MPQLPPVSFAALPALSPDEFWNLLFSGDPDFTEYHSLGALIRDSDAVVLATLVSVTAGGRYDEGGGLTAYNAWVHIRVDRVLHGSLSTTTPVINVVAGDSSGGGDPYVPVVNQLKASMPTEQGVLFIQNLGAWEKRLTGKSSSDPSVYAVISAQGIFRNANGVAKKTKDAPGSWPQGFNGKSFGADCFGHRQHQTRGRRQPVWSLAATGTAAGLQPNSTRDRPRPSDSLFGPGPIAVFVSCRSDSGGAADYAHLNQQPGSRRIAVCQLESVARFSSRPDHDRRP